MRMVEIVVIAQKQLSDFKRCIHSVLTQTPPSSYHLTIVYHSGNAAIGDYLKSLQFNDIASFSIKDGFCFASAAKWAVEKTQAEHLIFLNDECEVTAGWFEPLVSSIEADSQTVMAGCKIISSDSRIISSDIRLGPHRVLYFKDNDLGQADYVKEADLISDACFLMRRSLFDTAGNFDLDKDYEGQEGGWDYCLRVRSAGFKIIYNGFSRVIYHDGSNRIKQTKKKFDDETLRQGWDKTLEIGLPDKTSHPADQSMSQAIRELAAERYSEALNLSEKLRGLYPEMVEDWIPALAYIRLKKYGEALHLLQKLVERNADNYSARNYLTLCLRKLGLQNDADEYTNRMLACVTKNINLKKSIF